MGGFILDANGNISTAEDTNGTGIFNYATGKEIKPFPGGLLESASTVSKQAQWQRELLRAAQNAHGTEEGPVLDGLHHSLPDHARVSAAWFLTSHVQTSCAAVRGS